MDSIRVDMIVARSRWKASAEALQFEISCQNTTSQEHRQAVLSVFHAQSWKREDGWKAVIRVDGESDRYFGTWRSSISEAARVLLKTHSHRISATEQERLLKRVVEMQMRRTASAYSSPTSVQVEAPSQGGDEAVYVAPSQGACPINGIKIVHQIYGLFKDDKPMSTLFVESQKSWQAVAKSMSAHYHLWNAGEVESLVKQRYPQYWDMYSSVRYPVMRCDIGRLLIIHAYGGLYADLDTKPNRSWYEQVELALPRVKDPRKIGLSAKQKRRRGFSIKASDLTGDNVSYLDMEVIVGTAGNEIFIRWMNYISEEIQEKSYARGSFWYHAKMRYIFHTSGPCCMNRFFRLTCNAEWLAAKRLHHLECNHFRGADRLTAVEKRAFDVISYQSQSFFTDAIEIHVPVGAGDTPLPCLPVARRLHSKRPRSCMYSNVNDMELQVVLSQEKDISSANREETASSDPMLEELKLQNHTLEHELEGYRAREAELKRYVFQRKNCVSTQVFLEDMPQQLAKWIWPLCNHQIGGAGASSSKRSVGPW